MNTRPTESHIPSHLIIPDFVVPGRADKILADLLPGEITRSSISRLLKHGFVTWEGRQIKPSAILRPGQEILILHLESASELSSPPDEIVKRPEILFEDEHVIVLDKPAGLVIHPGAGRSSTTLMDILVDSRPGMIGIGEPGRWGIVHRLDKDTSGVMVVAKSTAAYNELSNQFRLHSVGKIYLALVRGNPGMDAGVINKELGRSRSDRKRMSTVTGKGRAAVTSWKVKQRFGSVTLLEIHPETGRTHQIRVHLASIGLPILGDKVYGTKSRKKKHDGQIHLNLGSVINRQALHAAQLTFKHPTSFRIVEFFSPLPHDIQEAIRICGGIII